MHEAPHFDAFQTHHDAYQPHHDTDYPEHEADYFYQQYAHLYEQPHGQDHSTFYNVHAEGHPLPSTFRDRHEDHHGHDAHFADRWLQ